MGKKLITPRTRGMKVLMEQVAGEHQMRLQKELDRVTAMELVCDMQTYATATAQDDFGRNKTTSRLCSIADNKALIDLELFRGMKTLHIKGENKSVNLYPHKWPDSIENLLVDSYELLVGLVPHLERLVNLKRLLVQLKGNTIELPQKVKERLELFCGIEGEDYGFLEGCTKLEKLEIKKGGVSSMKTIPSLPALKALSLPNFGGCSLDGIERLAALEHLNVTGGNVADIGAVAKLKKLGVIGLSDNHISDISPLAKLPLETLDIRNNMVEDIAPLAGQGGLVYLDIAHNPVGDLAPIGGCTAMELLHIQDTWVDDVSPLFGMVGLEELVLDVRPIKDKARLEGLSHVGTVNGKFFVDFMQQVKREWGE